MLEMQTPNFYYNPILNRFVIFTHLAAFIIRLLRGKSFTDNCDHNSYYQIWFINASNLK